MSVSAHPGREMARRTSGLAAPKLGVEFVFTGYPFRRSVRGLGIIDQLTRTNFTGLRRVDLASAGSNIVPTQRLSMCVSGLPCNEAQSMSPGCTCCGRVFW